MGTSKILNNYTDVGTALGIRTYNFTEDSSTGYPRHVAFCAATVHSPFSFPQTALYKQLDKTSNARAGTRSALSRRNSVSELSHQAFRS